MAFVVERAARPGTAGTGPVRRFEVRESVVTDRGPRARSLVTFTELDEVAMAKARARALRPFDDTEVTAAARRLGAPVVVESAVERHARALLAELRRGNRPPPVLAALIVRALGVTPEIDDNVEAAAEWIGVDDGPRGEAIADLLDLADAMPAGARRSDQPSFPRIESR
ncbi:MAG: hypothetical protein FJW95_02830 [Actinobacteria bacterium]|nr:hypothetical protein [Actinomycetota bacterium]